MYSFWFMVSGYSINLYAQVWGGMSWREELLLWSRTGWEPRFPPPPGSCTYEYQCCGSASFWCRSGSDFWCRSRPRLASKQCRSTCGYYPKFYTSWKIEQNCFTFILSNASLQCFSFLISGKCVLKYFWIRIGIPWMPIRIPDRIRQMMRIRPDPDPDPQHWYLFSGCSGSITFTTSSVSDPYVNFTWIFESSLFSKFASEQFLFCLKKIRCEYFLFLPISEIQWIFLPLPGTWLSYIWIHVPKWMLWMRIRIRNTVLAMFKYA